MTVEVKSEETQMAEVSVEPTKAVKASIVAVEIVKIAEGDAEAKKEDEPKTEEVDEVKKNEGVAEAADASPSPVPSPAVSKSSSFKEESNFLSDLSDNEKKALIELKSKLEEAILQNKLFEKEEEAQKEQQQQKEKEKEKPAQEDGVEKEKPGQEDGEEKGKPGQEGGAGKEEIVEEIDEEKEKSAPGEEEKEKPAEKGVEEKKPDAGIEEKAVEVDKDISLWGVPLLPSKGAEGTNVVLLKFLRAREFKVNEAFEMLRNTLQWRKEFKIHSILEEDFGADLSSVSYMSGVDREGHPVCYNIYGAFENNEFYQKTLGTEEKRQQFLRWRFQLMEKGIQKLDFKPGCVSSLLQISDLKNSPGPSKKDLRGATKQIVGLLQDNYPEFVARNIFINVPFWYYAFYALLSPFLTQRTKSKFVFARPAKVTETLLKYIPAEEIPVRFGGFKRENDFEFSIEGGGVLELIVKAGSTETIEIPAPEVGTTLLWDLTVLGWEVNYKEEFVPSDEGSYTVIVQKGKKMVSHEEPVRNSFRNNEPGKVVLMIENGSFKKKRILYRYKTKKSSSA